MDKKSLLLDLGEKIKSTRRAKGMTQEELASALGIDGITVSRWETGKQSPDYITLWRISETFGISLPTMLTNEKVGIEYCLQYSRDIRHRKSNVTTSFERILSDLARLNPDIIVMIHEIAGAWDNVDDSRRLILSEGLSFVFGNFWSSQKNG